MAINNIIYNENSVWEQVFYFLKKKDIAIEKKKDYFWNKIIPTFIKAFLSDEHIRDLELHLKKNEGNTTYPILKIVKIEEQTGVSRVRENIEHVVEYASLDEPYFEDIVYFYLDNEEITIEKLKEQFELDDIIVLQRVLINTFEKLHLDRNKILEQLSKGNEYLTKLLNPRMCNKYLENMED